MKIKLQKNGSVEEVKVGVNFPILFFGFLATLVKGDLKYTAILLIALVVGFFTAGIVTVICNVFIAFKYNENRVNELMANGYNVVIGK